MSECVKVVVRCRPMNKLEIGKSCINIVEIDNKTNQVTLNNTN